MIIKDLIKNIQNHKNLILFDIEFGNTPDKDYIIIKNNITKEIFKIIVCEILKYNWKEVENILTGKRLEKVLSHISRVVGYYSKIENWNNSKIGELKDRQKGNYKI